MISRFLPMILKPWSIIAGYRGEWWNGMTITWETISKGELRSTPPVEANAPGASLFVPFSLEARRGKNHPANDGLGTFQIQDYTLEWSPQIRKILQLTPVRITILPHIINPGTVVSLKTVEEVAAYWTLNYDDLKGKTTLFSNAFLRQYITSGSN